MKNGQTRLLGGIILYGSVILVMSIIVFFITACQPEEKRQSASLPAIDSSRKGQPLKNSSATKDVFPGGDTIQQECQLIQGQAESLLEEYHQRSTTDAREREILIELKKLEQKWKQMECQQVFGYMLPPDSSPTGKQIVK